MRNLNYKINIKKNNNIFLISIKLNKELEFSNIIVKWFKNNHNYIINSREGLILFNKIIHYSVNDEFEIFTLI